MVKCRIADNKVANLKTTTSVNDIIQMNRYTRKRVKLPHTCVRLIFEIRNRKKGVLEVVMLERMFTGSKFLNTGEKFLNESKAGRVDIGPSTVESF